SASAGVGNIGALSLLGIEVIEVVEAEDVVAISEQAIDEVRADEPGRTSDKDFHGRLILSLANTRLASSIDLPGAILNNRGRFEKTASSLDPNLPMYRSLFRAKEHSRDVS